MLTSWYVKSELPFRYVVIFHACVCTHLYYVESQSYTPAIQCQTASAVLSPPVFLRAWRVFKVLEHGAGYLSLKDV